MAPHEERTNAEDAQLNLRGQVATRPTQRNPAPSVIGAGLTIVGDLESFDHIQINGTIEGTVKGKAVTIGEGAHVKGSVYALSVQVAGTVEGTIKAESVELARTAQVAGDVSYRSLQVEMGATLDCAAKGSSST
jgi:cytoskeletal protein CcmA (bactofilin family)